MSTSIIDTFRLSRVHLADSTLALDFDCRAFKCKGVFHFGSGIFKGSEQHFFLTRLKNIPSELRDCKTTCLENQLIHYFKDSRILNRD